MKKAQTDYKQLHEISTHAQIISSVISILDWDQETYMPPGSAAFRSLQLEAMAGIHHEARTSKKFVNALSKLVDIESGEIIAKGLSPEQNAALQLWHRDYKIEVALPKSFVEEFAKLTSQTIIVWRDAKKRNAFHQFAPFLDRVVSMVREKADLIGYKDHPYDALLDHYEPYMTTKEVAHVFSALKKPIAALVKKIAKAKQMDDHFLFGKFPQAKQLAFAKRLLIDMGFDMSKGRLDLSAHPFSSSPHPTDSRVTTRIHASSLMSNLSAALHEGGHSLYAMGLPIEHYGSPLGDAISLGVHESQSRWWETRIGQSKPFWKHYLPLLQKEFGGPLSNVSLETFYKAINKVEPSFIRVEADEVTYPLHVILRFELECALIEGKLKVREIPEAWNAGMKEHLGITPKNDTEGCLQDIHWPMGGFGYFPTYALGNMYAAHLFEKFEKDHPNWAKRVSQGELTFIKDWLAQAVYQHGRRYSSKDLLKKSTGKPFSSDAYIQYLTKKYNDIYFS